MGADVVVEGGNGNAGNTALGVPGNAYLLAGPGAVPGLVGISTAPNYPVGQPLGSIALYTTPTPTPGNASIYVLAGGSVQRTAGIATPTVEIYAEGQSGPGEIQMDTDGGCNSSCFWRRCQQYAESGMT